MERGWGMGEERRAERKGLKRAVCEKSKYNNSSGNGATGRAGNNGPTVGLLPSPSHSAGAGGRFNELLQFSSLAIFFCGTVATLPAAAGVAKLFGKAKKQQQQWWAKRSGRKKKKKKESAEKKKWRQMREEGGGRQAAAHCAGRLTNAICKGNNNNTINAH